MSAKAKTPTKTATSTIAKNADGTVQITFKVPYTIIEKVKNETAQEMGKNLEIPGFRKGNAPLKKVIEHIPENTLLEKTLGKILPEMVGRIIEEHKLKPVIYPKFELLKATEGEDWEIRAETAEIPEFTLPDYKKEITGELKAKSIWTPGKVKAGDQNEMKEPTPEEKEQEVLKILLNKTDLKLPKLLVDEETNSRISKLLERLEKLGLNLESYLASIGTTADKLRKDYEEQAQNAIKLDLILTKIADKENIIVSEEDLNSAIGASAADPKLAEELKTPDRIRLVESILRRRKVLGQLVSLN